MQYRADIDGLRAVAVVAVVLFHAHVPLFRGGFVGVDVFFVISGYLITGIILADCDRGRFSLLRFYDRRVRRIFPALFAVLLVTLAAGAALLLPEALAELAVTSAATTLFASNFYFWQGGDYFASTTEMNALLHTWSLAVEEQFYIFHPIALALAVRFLRRWLVHLLIVTALASFALNLWLTANDPRMAFYLFPGRAWELLLGAVLATGRVPAVPERLRDATALIGLAGVAYGMLGLSDSTPFPGWAALAPCLGTALVIHAGLNGPNIASRLLSRPPVVFVGLISYSLYLWHWPALALLKHYYASPKLPPAATTLAVVAATALAVVSWRFVERPFRDRQRLERRVVFRLAAAGMALTLVASIALKLGDGYPERFEPQTLALAAAARDVDPRSRECLARTAPDVRQARLCVLGVPGIASFIFWGDSHAAALIPAIDLAAKSAGVTGVFAGNIACAPLLGVTRPLRGGSYDCKNFNDAVVAAIAASSTLSTVVLSARWSINAEGLRYRMEPGKPVLLADRHTRSLSLEENRAVFDRGLQRTLATLSSHGKNIVLVGPVPEVGWDVPAALAMDEHTSSSRSIAPRMEEFNLRQAFVLQRLEAGAQQHRTALLLPHTWLCNDTRCPVMIDGVPRYVDDDHLSLSAARVLAPLFRDAIATRRTSTTQDRDLASRTAGTQHLNGTRTR